MNTAFYVVFATFLQQPVLEKTLNILGDTSYIS